MPETTLISKPGRRYDVDWLRSLAFILLIFYHVGLLYVSDWEWLIKSEYQSEFLQNVMIFSNQWRMPLIFFLSGIALCLVESKISGRQLMSLRFKRLIIPILIGVFFIVPPQIYFELRQSMGFSGNYWEFWSFYLDIDTHYYPEKQHHISGFLSWEHLWYLVYLWHYTLVYLAIKPLFHSSCRWLAAKRMKVMLYYTLPVLIMMVYGALLRSRFPTTLAFIDDWYNHAMYFTVFWLGYVLAKTERVWQAVVDNRQTSLGVAVFCFVLLMGIHNQWLGVDYKSSMLSLLIAYVVVYTNIWMWVLSLVGFAAVYLNRPSRVLYYLNDAILPWYILHQTVIIVIAYYLSRYQLGGVIESLLVIVGTFFLCGVIYEIIRRYNILRFLFGMKLKRARK